MRILFYLGWVLLIGGFVSAAAEQVVRLYPGASTMLTPAYDLWYTLWPGGLTIAQIRIERIAPMLWDPLLTTVLAFPAWFLLGMPGVTLAWFCRPNRVLTPSEQEDHRKHVESLFLYDELAKKAKAEGHASGPDDMLPDHDGHDALDEAERASIPTDEELIEAILAARNNPPEPPKLT